MGKTYMGVGNNSQKMKTVYIGIDNVAKKMKRGYIGDENGIARLVYSWIEWDPVLENNSWEVISEVSKAGLASTAWNIGDQKTIYIDGVAYLVDIIGFDHDIPTNSEIYKRDKAGITFQLQSTISSAIRNGSDWVDSEIRTEELPNTFNKLNIELQNVIVPVNKLTVKYSTDQTETSLITTSDNLFLLSVTEIMGDVSGQWAGGQGLHYANYYIDANSRIKYRGNNTVFWLTRSTTNTGGDDYYIIDNYGNCVSRGTGNTHVSFAFCV